MIRKLVSSSSKSGDFAQRASDIGYKYGNQDQDNLVDQYCNDPVNTNLKEKVQAGTEHLPYYQQKGEERKKYGDEIKAYNKKYGTNEKPKD